MKPNTRKLLFRLNDKMTKLWSQIKALEVPDPTKSRWDYRRYYSSSDPEKTKKLEEQYRYALDESIRIAEEDEVEDIFIQQKLDTEPTT